MDLYHVWCNLKPGVSDLGFTQNVKAYLGELQSRGTIQGFRISRRKLGLAPPSLGEFHVQIEVKDLAQLDTAFSAASERSGPVEPLHAAVNQMAQDLTFALYRDFPDEHRKEGAEQF